MSTRKDKIKAALGKMVEAARELVEVEQACQGRQPRKIKRYPRHGTVLSRNEVAQ